VELIQPSVGPDEDRVGAILAHANLSRLRVVRQPLHDEYYVLQHVPTLTKLRELHLVVDSDAAVNQEDFLLSPPDLEIPIFHHQPQQAHAPAFG
jgi:hypothetical protein